MLVDEVLDHQNNCATDREAEQGADNSNDDVLLHSRLQSQFITFYCRNNLNFRFKILISEIALDQCVTASFHF